MTSPADALVEAGRAVSLLAEGVDVLTALESAFVFPWSIWSGVMVFTGGEVVALPGFA